MHKRNWIQRSAALLMCLVLAVGLAACTNDNYQPEASQSTEVTGTVETTAPTETKAAETEPEATAPTETKPEETKAEETKPVETKPAETKPAETKPAETKPAETQPKEPEPTEPKPTEPEATEPPASVCYLSISCSTILNNMADLEPGKEGLVPADGMLLYRTEITFTPGESVFDVLQRVTRDRGIHMSSRFTPMYDSAYIEGISNLYEFDCGSNSGWMYCVNGWYPNYGVSKYTVENGDEIQFNYTCDLGRDLPGGDWME